MDVVTSKDGPKLSADVLSHSAISHEFHCEKAWQNIIPILKLWLTELSGLKVSYIVPSRFTAHFQRLHVHVVPSTCMKCTCRYMYSWYLYSSNKCPVQDNEYDYRDSLKAFLIKGIGH